MLTIGFRKSHGVTVIHVGEHTLYIRKVKQDWRITLDFPKGVEIWRGESMSHVEYAKLQNELREKVNLPSSKVPTAAARTNK
jgi:hypothetical protein